MAHAPVPSGLVSTDYTELPPAAQMVRTLANEVTRRRAEPLREGGRPAGLVPQERRVHLLAARRPRATARTTWSTFLSDGNRRADRLLRAVRLRDGRDGPDAGHPGPGRGRLPRAPTQWAETWEYSAHDLHAWPELFFPGSGWVRFEPTPAGPAPPCPATPPRTSGRQPLRRRPDARSPATTCRTAAPATAPAPAIGRGRRRTPTPARASRGARRGRAGRAGAPGRPGCCRERCVAGAASGLAGGPEAAWAELRATALDLGVPWPEGRSPRETRRPPGPLLRRAGRPRHRRAAAARRRGGTRGRGRAGPDRPDAGALALRPGRREPAGSLRADVEACWPRSSAASPRGARRRAEWWPRSVLSRAGRQQPAQAEPPVQARSAGWSTTSADHPAGRLGRRVASGWYRRVRSRRSARGVDASGPRCAP